MSPRAVAFALSLALVVAPGALADRGNSSGDGTMRTERPAPVTLPTTTTVAVPVVPPRPGSGDSGDGTRTTPTPSGAAGGSPPVVPRSVATDGLWAGTRGGVEVREYVDFGDAACAAAHERVVPALMLAIANEDMGALALRPLITGSDQERLQAAVAVIAAARQDRAWQVTSALFRAQGTSGSDWVNRTTLRGIASGIGGLAVTRFLRDAHSRSAYPQLNAIRQEARKAGVTVTPAFVVRGPGGTRMVRAPESADAVLAAVRAVQ